MSTPVRHVVMAVRNSAMFGDYVQPGMFCAVIATQQDSNLLKPHKQCTVLVFSMP